jgi:hypothetical protein
MFAIEEIITDTAGQDARKACAGLVNGLLFLKRRVREDLRTFVPSRSVNACFGVDDLLGFRFQVLLSSVRF